MPFRRIKKGLQTLLVRRSRYEIEPDEIFLDSSNLPEFDESQFEGRIEKPVSKFSIIAIGCVFMLIIGAGLVKTWSLQIARGASFAELASNNSLRHSAIFPTRGVIYDRNGIELAWNEQQEGDDFPARHYVEMPGLSHILGYVSYPKKDRYGVYFQDEFVGKDGVEKQLSKILGGTNGLKIVETDAQGKVKSESIIEPPKNGKDLTLSIDSALSSALYNDIAKTAHSSRFVGGAGIVMDVQNGEIIAMASYPEYDAETLASGKDAVAINGYLNDSRKPFLNRVVSGLYTPGSIVKPFVALGVLDQGIIDPKTKILSTGSIKLANPFLPGQFSIFKDWKARGYVDMRHALAVSSDVYFYEVGGGFENQRGLGIEKLNYYNRMFGFGEKTGIAFEGEQAGNIPTPAWKEEHFNGDPWRVGDTYNTAIGQYGFQVTPIQVVRAIAAVGNGGTLVTPSLEKGVVLPHTTLSLVPEHLHVVQEGMRMSVQEGTAAGLSNTHVAIAAKTGTAELGARKQFVNSWTTGFFPYENPRYAFAVIMERGPVTNLVGATSVMRQFIDWMIAHTPEYLSSS